MNSSDFRKDAREKLTGKWSTVAVITLIYMAISLVLSVFEQCTKGFANEVVNILVAVVSVPLGFGLVNCFVKLFNGEEVKYFDFLNFGFDNFGKSWGISLRTALKLILPIILMIVSICFIIFGSISVLSGPLTVKIASPLYTSDVDLVPNSNTLVFFILGCFLYVVSFIWLIAKSYYYDLTYIIAAENLDMPNKDIIDKSKELMKNNRLKLFCLEFSFFGWALLAALSFGIGMLWLLPYMQFARISFYKHLLNKEITE